MSQGLSSEVVTIKDSYCLDWGGSEKVQKIFARLDADHKLGGYDKTDHSLNPTIIRM